MKAEELSQDVLDLLRKYDTPTVCNVIELFDFRPHSAGYMDSRIKACFPEMPPVVGYAVTATFRSAAPARGGNVYAVLDDVIDAFGQVGNPPIVVIQDLDDPPAAATFGEVMCSTYKGFGAAGIITSGGARDLEQIRALQFPAFSNGSICAHGYCHIPNVQVPVRVGGVAIYPGILLHADCNGVTTIPVEIASEVAHACAEFAAAEQFIIGYVKGGNPARQGLTEAQKEFSSAIVNLRRRLNKK